MNAWWSPLYPWTVGVVLGVTKPSPWWEFPLVHAVDLVIFVMALVAFRWLLHAWLEFRREPIADAKRDATESLPDWAFVLMAFALQIETLYDVSPDLV